MCNYFRFRCWLVCLFFLCVARTNTPSGRMGPGRAWICVSCESHAHVRAHTHRGFQSAHNLQRTMAAVSWVYGRVPVTYRVTRKLCVKLHMAHGEDPVYYFALRYFITIDSSESTSALSTASDSLRASIINSSKVMALSTNVLLSSAIFLWVLLFRPGKVTPCQA